MARKPTRASEPADREPAADEPIGWFRDESIDEADEGHPGEAADAVAVAAVAAAAATDETAGAETAETAEAADEAGEAGDEEATHPARPTTRTAVVRDRDRPVLAPAPGVPPPPRGRRLRGILIGIVTIAAVAAVGFVAGLMLPIVLPGPGVDTTPPPSTPARQPRRRRPPPDADRNADPGPNAHADTDRRPDARPHARSPTS